MPKEKSKPKASAPQESKSGRYSAPALEKGLDVLELLAKEREPMTRAMICDQLKRSHSELFRMIQVLESRGFIHQTPDGSGFAPTDKLFTLGMEQAPVKTMLEVALPIMRELTHRVRQSCHLSVRQRDRSRGADGVFRTNWLHGPGWLSNQFHRSSFRGGAVRLHGRERSASVAANTSFKLECTATHRVYGASRPNQRPRL